MKKSRRILLLCGVLLILLCFVGCTQSSVDTSEPVGTESQTESTDGMISDLPSDSETDSATPSTDVSSSDTKSQEEVITDSHVTDSYSGRWTSDAYFVDTVDGLGTEDCLLFENDIYCIERIDGECYLTFREGKEPQELISGGCIVHSPYIIFNNIDEMFVNITQKALKEEDLRKIRTFFTKDEKGRYWLMDPYRVRLPAIPSIEAKTVLYGVKDLGFWLQVPKDLSEQASLKFEIITESAYKGKSGFSSNYEQYGYTVSHEEDRNATVYHKTNDNGWRSDKYYVLQDGEKTLYVREIYNFIEHADIESEAKTIPGFLEAYGTDGEGFFHFVLNSLDFRPTVEWLLSIETAPYVPKQ